MGKRIELESENVKIVAELLEDQAPKTTQRFWDSLPIEEDLRHVRWSGNASYILVQDLRDAEFPVENRVSFYEPATICLKPDKGELAFSYGQAQARDPKGMGWATHFANIEGDTEAFYDLLVRTQREGKKRMAIRRIES